MVTRGAVRGDKRKEQESGSGCPNCHGQGVITQNKREGIATILSIGKCPKCGGTGK